MLATTGFVTTPFAVAANRAADSVLCLAHSTETETSVHSVPQRHLDERHAEQHVVREDATQREYRLRDAVVPERGAGDGASDREHDQAAAEVGEEDSRVDRRQRREVAHEPEQERGDRDREHEPRQRIGRGRGPAAASREAEAQCDQREQRRRQRDEVQEGRHRARTALVRVAEGWAIVADRLLRLAVSAPVA